jgi:hypothetical protein
MTRRKLAPRPHRRHFARRAWDHAAARRGRNSRMEFGILFTSHPNTDAEPYPHRAVHARVTREILRADQLGYDCAWLAEGEQQRYWWFIPNIKNSGNTPTENMKYFIGSSCPPELSWAMAGHMAIVCDFTRQDILDPVEIFNRQAFKITESAAILGPQSAVPLGGIGITEASIQAVIKGFKLFVFGLIYYNDTFPETEKHVTKFCYQAGANLSDKNEIISSPIVVKSRLITLPSGLWRSESIR